MCSQHNTALQEVPGVGSALWPSMAHAAEGSCCFFAYGNRHVCSTQGKAE
jgi:hypothetical protein